MARLFRKRPRQLTLPGVDVPRERPIRSGDARRPGLMRRARLSLVTVPMTRRRFLTGTLYWVTAGIAAAVGLPAAAAVVAPALRKSAQGWSPIANIVKPAPGEPDLSREGEPVLTNFTSLVEDAYLSAQPQETPVFVVNLGKGQFTIFDVRCTHLGCPVERIEKDSTYLSPCHGGVFDDAGKVLAGPPPRPLDRYEYKIENDILFAGKLYQVNERLERITT